MGTYIQHKLNEIFVENDFSDLDTDEPLPDEDHFGGYILTGKKADTTNTGNTIESSLSYQYDPTEPDIEIEFECSPGERRTYDYPGSEPHMDVLNVWLKHTGEIIEIIDPELENEIEEEVWDYLTSNEPGFRY